MAEGFDTFEGDAFEKSFNEVDDYGNNDFDFNINEAISKQDELQVRLDNIDRGQMSQDQIYERNNLKIQLKKTLQNIENEKVKTAKKIISILHKEYVKLKEYGRVKVRDA